MAPPTGIRQVKLNAVMFAMMLDELLTGPCTAKHISEVTGMAGLTVNRTFRAMYRRRVVHVAGWEKDAAGRHTVRVFALGPGRDAKIPKKSKAQMNRECIERKRLSLLVGAVASNDSRKAA